MSWDSPVTMESDYFYNGQPANMAREQRDRTLRVHEAFHILWHTIEFYPYQIGELTAGKVTITKFPDETGHTSIMIDDDGQRRRVKAEKEIMTFTGDPADIKVLLEYIYWAHKDDEIPPHLHFAFAFDELDGCNPSALPQHLIGDYRVGGVRSIPAMIQALEFYGFTAVELAEIGQLTSSVKWLDIAATNDIWLAEGAGRTFPDVLREHGLLRAVA